MSATRAIQLPRPERQRALDLVTTDRSIVSSERALAVLTSRLPIRGREWLADKLFARHTLGHEWWTVRIGQGLRLRLPASSRQSWIAAFTGTYDENQINLLATYLRPGSVVLDIGASLGLYTLQLAERASSLGARVIAIEPIPANADIVRENVRRNNLSPYVSVIEVAVGIQTGVVTMQVEQGGAGNATVTTGVDESAMVQHSIEGGLGPSVEIAVKPLDGLLFDEPVSVVKIDTEGFEMDILAGGDHFIERHRPLILAEFSEPWMRSRGRSLEEPFLWAVDHDYRVYNAAIVSTGRILKKTSLHLTEIKSSDNRGDAELLLVPR